MATSRLIDMSRCALVLGVVAGLTLASQGAMAGGNQVNWSVNIDAPLQGSGRVSTAISNTRGGYNQGYGQGYYQQEPVAYMPPPAVMYAPPPRVVYAPRVMYAPPPMYYGAPAYGYGYGRHHGHHGERVARRVMSNVHGGLARLHEDIAAFHASRAQAWGQPGYAYGPGPGRRGDWR